MSDHTSSCESSLGICSVDNQQVRPLRQHFMSLDSSAERSHGFPPDLKSSDIEDVAIAVLTTSLEGVFGLW